MRVWDSTQPGSTRAMCISGTGEILACDWSKYDHHTLVTAGVDMTIKYVPVTKGGFIFTRASMNHGTDSFPKRH